MALGSWINEKLLQASGNPYRGEGQSGVKDLSDTALAMLTNSTPAWALQGEIDLNKSLQKSGELSQQNQQLATNRQTESDQQTEVDLAAQAEAQRQATAQAAANPILQQLASLDTILGNRLSGAEQEFNRIKASYADQNAADKAAYEGQVNQNEKSLLDQRSNKMLSGAKLAQNLRSVLASMGALNGTGSFLANQAVQDITNAGLADSRQTFDVNAGNITSNWEQAEREQRQRQQDAEKLFANKQANIRGDVLSNRQAALNQLANIFGTDTAQGQNYLGQAGALYGDIAATTKPNVGEYAKADSRYSPAALQQYLSGIGNTNIGTQAGGSSQTPINSPLFALNDRRKDRQLA